MSNFSLDIYTPNGVLVRGHNCDSLQIPTSEGEITVLKGHTHIISKLVPGKIVAHSAAGKETFKVSEGISKVFGSKVTIMSQS